MKPINKFPTDDAAANREILRRIYEREMNEAIPAQNKALLIMLLGIVCAAVLLGIADLIFQFI